MLADAQRLDMLAAMGVDVYRLRGTSAASAHEVAVGATRHESIGHEVADAQVVVVCARDQRHAATHARLLAALPRALGVAPSALGWLEAGADGSLGAPPPASAYIVLGTSLIRSLGAQLSTKQQSATTIAVCADPGGLIRDGAAKRQLWQALKPVARRLRKAAD
jgi:hypothetical protein